MKNLKDKPFALVGVHVGGTDVKQLKEITENEKLPWRSFVDLGNAGAGAIARQWNHVATPTFYVLDHKGVIRYKGVRGEAMDKAVDTLLKEMESEKK